MGRPAGWMKELTGRSPMKSPGAPSHRREVEREFWAEIAKGLLPENAACVVGASQAVGARWFRHGGGMAPFDLKPLSGRYLSFREREQIALMKAQGPGVRHMARELGRDPSTISRELRRNAATRGGNLDYRASVAQWKAEIVARRPKTANWSRTGDCLPMCRNGCRVRSAGLMGHGRGADTRFVDGAGPTDVRTGATAEGAIPGSAGQSCRREPPLMTRRRYPHGPGSAVKASKSRLYGFLRLTDRGTARLHRSPDRPGQRCRTPARRCSGR